MITYISPESKIKEMSLDELLSQQEYTLLYFYPKNDTPGCTLEAQDFTKLIPEFSKHHIQVIGVSKDKAESHCKFIEKYSLKPWYISDVDLDLHKKFSTWWEKNNYWKLVMWVIRSTILLNTQGEVIHERRSIKAKGHAQRVLDWIEQNL